jgi:Flp pilus assembly protein TadD
MQKGKTDEAIRQYERALALRPDYSEAHHNLGVALQKEGRTEEARVQFEAAPRPR